MHSFAVFPDRNSENYFLRQRTIYGSARTCLSAGETTTTLCLLLFLLPVIRERVLMVWTIIVCTTTGR